MKVKLNQILQMDHQLLLLERIKVNTKRRIGIIGVKVLISTVLTYWILRGIDVTEILNIMKSANISFVVAAYSLIFVGNTISTFRWKVLLKAQGTESSFLYLFKSYLVGLFFSNLLPTTIGGDTVRIYYSWRIGKSKAKAIAVIFVDRLLGLFALILFAWAALMLSRSIIVNLPLLYFWMILGGGAIALAIWIIFAPKEKTPKLLIKLKMPFYRKIKSILAKILNAFNEYRGNGSAPLKALGLSILLQTNVVVHYYLISKALDFHIPIYSFFLIVPLALFIMMIPISINAIGLRENTFALILINFGISKTDAVAFAWIAFGFIIFQGILGGIVYALRRK